MKKILKCIACIILLGIITFVSCKKELSCEGCFGNNKPPIANAGKDTTITLPKDSVLLDGSASTDPDGTITSYKWTKIAGPVSANIAKPDSSKTRVKSLTAGVYQFELTVTDNGGLSAKDTVRVIIDAPGNQPPIANAGADTTITLPGTTTTLDGSKSFDPDNNITAYNWTKISGPSSFTIVNANASQTQATGLVQGVYRFELKVTDAGGLFSKDTVQITVDAGNQSPIACAGADQTIILPNNAAYLDGSCSADPDNNITAYTWTKISGSSSLTIANPNTAQTQLQLPCMALGVYQFELKVTDAGGLFSKDTVTIRVAQPVYNCGDTTRPHVSARLVPVGNLSEARLSMSVATAGNKVLFAGGTGNPGGLNHSSAVDILDVNTQALTTAKLSVGRYSIATACLGNKIFFGGGESGDGTSPLDAVDIYDVSANTWQVARLSAAGNSIAAAAVGNKVLFAGGDRGSYPSSSGTTPRHFAVDIYDGSTSSWSTASLLAPRRGGHSAITVGTKVYFAGGVLGPNGGVTNIIDVYDNPTNSWSTSNLKEPKSSMATVAVGNKIYWAGGNTGDINHSCSVEIRDVITGSSVTQQLSRPAVFVIDNGQNAVIKDNKIIFYSTSDYSKFDVYDITTNSWSIGVLPSSINGASIIAVNNTIYLAGGYVNCVLSNQIWKLEF